MVMAITHSSVIKIGFFLFFFLLVIIMTSGCDMLTGFAVKETPIAEPVYIRCSDTAGLTVHDYCQINNTLKFMFKNRQYVAIEGVLVTLLTENGNYQKDYPVRLNPSITQIIEMEFPEQYADYTFIEIMPSSFDPNGVIAPCRRKLIERENVRTCVYN